MGKINQKVARRALVAVALGLCLLLARGAAAKSDSTDAQDPAIPAALCQVVYPLDQTPEEGYRYVFLGNGFFVNDQGYLLTAAHLLSSFRHSGQPYILVGPPEGPRRMLEAPIVAADWEHDVAVLRATPNPFRGGKKIGYLTLSAELPEAGSGVVSASLRPVDIENALSARAPVEDFSGGEVIRYQFFREPGLSEKELVLYDAPVVSGQSGSPLVSAETHTVVGVVVGRWLHPAVLPTGNDGGHETISPGAAVRIHYAIGLLEQQRVAWHMAARNAEQPASPAAVAEQKKGFTAPVPLSVVPTRYPPQALYGSDVLLDARVETNGKLSDIRMVTGSAPFVEPVLDAVRTWTFVPARKDGRAVQARIGIVFQFPQSFLPDVTPREHKHPEAAEGKGDHAALPTVTIEPEYPANTTADGSVIFYGLVDKQGEFKSKSILRDVGALTAPSVSAAEHWVFEAGQQGETKTESAVVVVVTFRRPVT